MNEQVFWKMIEALHPSVYSPKERLERLEEDLRALPREDLFKFDKYLWWQMNKSATDELWAASCILARIHDATRFMDFRLWLIMQGQRVFKKALNDAETLENYVDDFKHRKIKIGEYLPLGSLAETVYKDHTFKEDYREVNTYLSALNYQERHYEHLHREFMDMLPELCHLMGFKVELYRGEWQSDV